MKYRLITSLLLVVVLGAAALVFTPGDTYTAPAPAPAAGQDDVNLKSFRIE